MERRQQEPFGQTHVQRTQQREAFLAIAEGLTGANLVSSIEESVYACTSTMLLGEELRPLQEDVSEGVAGHRVLWNHLCLVDILSAGTVFRFFEIQGSSRVKQFCRAMRLKFQKIENPSILCRMKIIFICKL